MASFNRVILVGNLTRDVELKFLPTGTVVTEVGLAVNSRRKNQAGEWVEEVVFVDVTLWGRTAEIAGEYLAKGSSVLIEGRLKLDTWEKEGQKHSKLRVVGEQLQMLGTARNGAGKPPRQFDESENSRPAGPETARSGGAEPTLARSVEPASATSGSGEDIPF